MDRVSDSFAWVVFFSTVYAWQFHPGHKRAQVGSTATSGEDCGILADLMLREYIKRFPAKEA